MRFECFQRTHTYVCVLWYVGHVCGQVSLAYVELFITKKHTPIQAVYDKASCFPDEELTKVMDLQSYLMCCVNVAQVCPLLLFGWWSRAKYDS